jgi:hypothetical protein
MTKSYFNVLLGVLYHSKKYSTYFDMHFDPTILVGAIVIPHHQPYHPCCPLTSLSFNFYFILFVIPSLFPSTYVILLDTLSLVVMIPTLPHHNFYPTLSISLWFHVVFVLHVAHFVKCYWRQMFYWFLELQRNETKNALPKFVHFELRKTCGSSKMGLKWRCFTLMDKLTYIDQTLSLVIQAHMTIPIWHFKKEAPFCSFYYVFWFCSKGCIEMVKILRTPKLEFQKLLRYGSYNFACS